MMSTTKVIKNYKWPFHYMPHQHAKPRRRQARFQMPLPLSRWEISDTGHLFTRLSRSLFAEQRRHSLPCYEPQARGQGRKKPTAAFAWKQAASRISLTISNEIGVYRHRYQLHTRELYRLIRLLWIAWRTQMCTNPKGIG